MNALAEIWHRLSGGDPREARQLERWSDILQLSRRELAEIVDDPRLSYRSYSIRKRQGARRQIDEPSGALKQLQRRLLRGYLSRLPVSSAATAFRPGISIASHARRHAGQQIVVTVDLADFFPSITSRALRRWFAQQGWHGLVLRVLMRLTAYRGSLPQGAPTSPALSNLINLQLDRDLTEMATLTRGHYSRYCDDLAFSWATDREPAGWRNQVEERLRREGYTINRQKGWRLQTAADHPELTGIAIHGFRLKPNRENAAKIWRLRWKAKSEHEWQKWQGYRGFLNMLRPSRYCRRVR